jgi:hypothetical protein
MRALFFVLISISAVTEVFSQKITLTQIDSSRVFNLKIFNNLPTSIGIKSSLGFSRFSEDDTLNLAIDIRNKQITSFCIDQSAEELELIEKSEYYQLILIYPQTYLSTNVRLDNMNLTEKPTFSVTYTTDISDMDIDLFGKRTPPIVYYTKTERKFLFKKISLNIASVSH